MKETHASVPDILMKLAEGMSIQSRAATKYWIALAITSTFTVMANLKDDHLILPLISLTVSPEVFYPFVFLLLSILVIGYGSANCQAISIHLSYPPSIA